MGRKVWLWIIAGLAILLALAVTAGIVLSMLGGDAPTPEVPDSSQEQTKDQEPVPSEQGTTEGTKAEDATTEATEPATQTATEPAEQPTEEPAQPTEEATQDAGPDVGANETPWG